MKINDTQQKLLEAYVNQTQVIQGQQAQNQQNVQRQPQPQAQVQATDKVDLSSGSRLMQQVNSAMNAPQPERTARVDALKQQVQQGGYQMDTGRVADRMMVDLIKELG